MQKQARPQFALWSALLVIFCGEDMGKMITDAHEFGAKENLNSKNVDNLNMDLSNNDTGRAIGLNTPIYEGDDIWSVANRISEQILSPEVLSGLSVRSER